MIRSSLTVATFANIAGSLLPIVVQIATVPLYIRIIGADRYGTLSLVWLLLGYFGLFDLGFGRAIASRVAQNHSDSGAAAKLFMTGAILSLCTGALGAIILYGAGYFLFEHVLQIPSEILSETRSALPFIALTLPVSTFISAISGGLQGRQAFVALNSAQLLGMLLYQVLPLVAATFYSSSVSVLVLAAIVGRLFSLFALLVLSVREFAPSQWGLVHRAEMVRLFSYGGWVTITGAISPLLNVFDRFVIGAQLGTGAVGFYSIPYSLMTRLSVLPTSLQVALFPRYAMLSDREARRVLETGLDIQGLAMTPLVVAAIGSVGFLLRLWLGDAVAGQINSIAQILLFGLWFNTLAYIPFSFLQSRGRPDIPAKLHVVELFFYTPALFIFIWLLGLDGAALAWTLRVVLDLCLLLYAVKVKVNWFNMFASSVTLTGALAAGLLGVTDALAGFVLYFLCLGLCCAFSYSRLPTTIKAGFRRKALSFLNYGIR